MSIYLIEEEELLVIVEIGGGYWIPEMSTVRSPLFDSSICVRDSSECEEMLLRILTFGQQVGVAADFL